MNRDQCMATLTLLGARHVYVEQGYFVASHVIQGYVVKVGNDIWKPDYRLHKGKRRAGFRGIRNGVAPAYVTELEGWFGWRIEELRELVATLQGATS